MGTEQTQVERLTAQLKSCNEALTLSLADEKVAKSRVEAYQHTCDKQGSKLARIEKILVLASDEFKKGNPVDVTSIGHVTFGDATLRELAAVMQEKGSNRRAT